MSDRTARERVADDLTRLLQDRGVSLRRIDADDLSVIVPDHGHLVWITSRHVLIRTAPGIHGNEAHPLDGALDVLAERIAAASRTVNGDQR